MGSCPTVSAMRGFLPFVCLLGLALTGPMVDHETNEMVHELGDAIEAGLMEPTEGEARALFISLTLTSTSTSLATATVTTTVTNSCVAGTFVDCSTTTTTTTTTTTVASTGRKKRAVHMMSRDAFMEEIHDFAGSKVTLNGKEVDINMILPTSPYARSDLDDAQTMFIEDNSGIQSGRMEWSEVAVESTTGLGSNCGRSGHNHDKRARIIALQNSVVTKNLTSTSTITSTAAATSTFSVTLASCTTSGFTFAVPLCTAAATGK